MTSGRWSNPVGARQLHAKIPCRRAPLDVGKFSSELTFEHAHQIPPTSAVSARDFSGQTRRGKGWGNRCQDSANVEQTISALRLPEEER